MQVNRAPPVSNTSEIGTGSRKTFTAKHVHVVLHSPMKLNIVVDRFANQAFTFAIAK
jgi:hypothetical protein